MKHISEYIDNFMKDINTSLENKCKQYETATPLKLTKLEGNQLFWTYIQELFQHEQFQQFGLFKMHLPDAIATRLRLRHNQQLEVYGKEVVVVVRPDIHWEATENTIDVGFEPIE